MGVVFIEIAPHIFGCFPMMMGHEGENKTKLEQECTRVVLYLFGVMVWELLKIKAKKIIRKLRFTLCIVEKPSVSK
jgi:hypothetical protein